MTPGTYTLWCRGKADGTLTPEAQQAALLDLTFEQAQGMFHAGRLSADEWEWYHAQWRAGCYRFSSL